MDFSFWLLASRQWSLILRGNICYIGSVLFVLNVKLVSVWRSRCLPKCKCSSVTVTKIVCHVVRWDAASPCACPRPELAELAAVFTLCMWPRQTPIQSCVSERAPPATLIVLWRRWWCRGGRGAGCFVYEACISVAFDNLVHISKVTMTTQAWATDCVSFVFSPGINPKN